MDIILALNKQENFNDTEKFIADYMLKQPQDILEKSVQEIANATFSSTSSIVRLCRKIGLKGFSDFKIQLSAQLQIKPTDILTVNPNFPFSENDTYEDVSKKIKGLYIDSVNQTATLYTNDLLEQAVIYLLSARNIGIFAYGDTTVAALNFQNKMMKIGYNIQMANLPGENRHLATNFSEKDCAILVSYSGESKNNYRIAQLLKENQTKLIVVTAYPNSHIGKMADCLLPIAVSESQTIKLSTFSSQIGLDYVLNSLFSCLYVANYETNQEKRLASEELFLHDRFL
ncbi:MAG: MurR/RpiR family transcriptional regulator [Vagococcus sp.]|uniref:MurR/RpiR family transcriptional regulator n=1 Tax=Vagococcus sp. TaxID=1933889 RepID=UPI002FC6C097